MVAMPDLTTTKRGYAGLEDYAKAHHSTAEVYRAAEWCEDICNGRRALAFSTKNGTRWRFLDGELPTYHHAKGYEMCWYGLKRAVDLANKSDIPFLVDCNGAASTVPAQHKGVPAFSLQSGEGTKPTEKLLTELKSVWKWTIIVAMDCDKPGREGAKTRVQEYRKAGFTCFAVDMQLPNEGGDLADFVALHENPNKVLQALPHLFVPEIVKKQATKKPIINNPGEQLDLAQRAIDALAVWRRDTYHEWTKVGMSLTELGNDGLLLWESWSRGSEKFKEGECGRKWRTFKAGAGIKLGSLFAWADEDSGKTWRPAKEVKTKASKQEQPTWKWSQGLPFGIRAALNLYADDPVAPILELWVEAINKGMCTPDDPVDIEFMVCAAESLDRKLSEKTIRRGMNLGCGQFLSNLSHNQRIYTKDSISIQESYSGKYIKSDKSDRNTTQCQPPLKAGRKSEMYKLLPIPQIVANVAKLAVTPILERAFPIKNGVIAPIRTEFLQELGCEPEQAAKLSAELISKYETILKQQPNYQRALSAARNEYKRFVRTLTNPASYAIPKGMEYKAGCARALVDFHGGETQFPRLALASMIGCTFRNLNAVLKRAEVYMVKDQFCEQPIKSLAHLRTINDQYNAECSGFPAVIKSSIVSKQQTRQFKARNPKMLAWADNELKKGAMLTILYRQANRQTLIQPDVPEKAKAVKEPSPDKPKQSKATRQNNVPKPDYSSEWVKQFTETVTPWQVEGDKMLDTQTGELQRYSPKAALEILRSGEAPIIEGDPLVDFLVSVGGVVMEIIEKAESTDGSNDTGRIQEGTTEISTGTAV